MALINCKDCGNEISDKAKQCVFCGCPIKKEGKNKKIITRIIICSIIVILLSIFLLKNILIGDNDNNNNNESYSIVGEWKRNEGEYFEIFDDGTFYYYGFFLKFVDNVYEDERGFTNYDGKCAIKGRYELTGEHKIKFYDAELVGYGKKCGGLNKMIAALVYGVTEDNTQICDNTGGICIDGYSYKKTNSTPYQIDKEGNKILNN